VEDTNNNKKLSIQTLRGEVFACALVIAGIVHNKKLDNVDIEQAFELAKKVLKIRPVLS
jgi:hypothetical protein